MSRAPPSAQASPLAPSPLPSEPSSPPPAPPPAPPHSPDVPGQLCLRTLLCVHSACVVLSLCTFGGAVFEKMYKTCGMNFKVVDSPLGKIEMSGCEKGLHGIKLLGQKTPEVNPAVALASPEDTIEPLTQCAAWLEAYFRDPASINTIPMPALHHPVFQQDSFTRQVLWELLKTVKVGEVVSYQQLAALAGNPRAARAVGGAMRNNPIPILIPCHRVISSGGTMGGYSGGLNVKQWLLAHEGGPVGTKLGGMQPKLGTRCQEMLADVEHVQRG